MPALTAPVELSYRTLYDTTDLLNLYLALIFSVSFGSKTFWNRKATPLSDLKDSFYRDLNPTKWLFRANINMNPTEKVQNSGFNVSLLVVVFNGPILILNETTKYY